MSNRFAAADHWGKGVDAEVKGDHERAIIEYQQSLRFDPSDHYVRYSLGGVYERQKKYEAAITEYQKAVILARAEPDGLLGVALAEYQMGNAYFEKGDYAGAAQAYQRVIALSPPAKNIKDFLAVQKSAVEYLEESKRLLHDKA